MNTGIGDAINLAWKLAMVLRGRPAKLLDSYEEERIAFARRLVSTTDRVFQLRDGPGPLADRARARAAHHVRAVSAARGAADSLQHRLADRVEYRAGPSARALPVVSTAATGSRGCDRTGRTDNFAPLASLRWQAHVYGAATPGLAVRAPRPDVPLHIFRFGPAERRAGMVRSALPRRPDGYVALADPSAERSAARAVLRKSPFAPGADPRARSGNARNTGRS